MTTKEALILVDNTIKRIALSRHEHALLVDALATLKKDAITDKEERHGQQQGK